MTIARLDIEQVKAAAIGKWRSSIIPSLGISVRDDRRHGPCPICGGKDRFRFDDQDGRGTWFCNQCDPQAGDGFSLIQNYFNCDFVRAAERVANVLGVVSGTQNGRAHDSKKRDHAQEILDGVSVDHGLVSAYLVSRGLSGTVPTALHIHPNLPYWQHQTGAPIHMGDYPAMVAEILDVKGRGLGAHVTYLEMDGCGKANVPDPKKSHKRTGVEVLSGGAIHITGSSSDQPLLLSEGVETGLALYESTGLPTWACISATYLESAKVPDSVKTILIAADLDQSGAVWPPTATFMAAPSRHGDTHHDDEVRCRSCRTSNSQ